MQGRTLEQIESYFNGNRDSIPPDNKGSGLVKCTALGSILTAGIIILVYSL
jgi:hypothetical protein